MNQITRISKALFIIFAFVAVSCGDNEPIDPALLDDQNNGGGNNGGGQTSLVGTYKMTAFNTSVPTDLNGDGVASTNQMNETNCFDNSFLVLNVNNTFTANAKGVDVEFDFVNGEMVTTLSCYTEPNTIGTWSIVNNRLRLSYTEDGETFSDDFEIQGNTLKFRVEEGEVVGVGSNGEPVFLTASIEIIYTKI